MNPQAYISTWRTADPHGWGVSTCPSGCSSSDGVVGRSNPPYLNDICPYHQSNGTNRSFLFLYQQRTLARPILLVTPCVRPPPPPHQSPQQVVGIWDLTTRWHDRSQPGMCDSVPVCLLGVVAVSARFPSEPRACVHSVCHTQSVTECERVRLAFTSTETLLAMTLNPGVPLLKVWEAHEQSWSGSGGGHEGPCNNPMWPFFTNTT